MFVTSVDYDKVVASIAKEEGELLVAVAFWGRGAKSIVHPRPSGPVKIICNLRSGATNPAIIEALHRKRNVTLKQYDRLHAKVVVGSKTAVVGSANFSSNGLNLEGEESAGWQEAGLVTQDPVEIEAINSWFRTIWGDAHEISPRDIKEAKKRWKKRRNSRIPKNSDSSRGFTLDSFTRAELLDRRIFVVVYSDDLSEDAISAYHRREEELMGQYVARRQEPSSMPPIYESWEELPKDAQLIDIQRGPRGGMKCHGVYTRTDDMTFEYADGSPGSLQICRKDDQIMGYRFGPTEALQFSRKLKPHIDAIWKSDLAVGGKGGKYICLVDIVDIVDICG